MASGTCGYMENLLGKRGIFELFQTVTKTGEGGRGKNIVVTVGDNNDILSR